MEQRGFCFIRICVKDRSGSPKVEQELNRTATAESLTAAEVWSRWGTPKNKKSQPYDWDLI